MRRTPRRAGGAARQADLFAARQEPPSRAHLPPSAEAEVAVPPVAPRPPERGGPDRSPLTVGELTARLKRTLEQGFERVCVRGEVSGFRGANARGHLYFNLKDAEATLDTRIWASLARRLKFRLEDGMEVVADGSIDLYAPSGRYSLIVSRIEPAGRGALALAFEQLQERLCREGLMGDNRRRPPRPIPFLPERIGVVTSRTGAALRDFLRVLHLRNPRISVLLCDARVQGDGSADEVAGAIDRLGRVGVDVVVVTRGGGSIEDLWTFNEEKVARAIFACPVPVVSAVGHEVDFTIADFVADLRVATPSAAAERLAPALDELTASLATSEVRLRKAMERILLEERRRLETFSARLSDPRRVLGRRMRELAELFDRASRAMRARWRAERERERALAERLARNSPVAKLAAHRRTLVELRARLERAGRATSEARRVRQASLKERLHRGSPQGRLHRERALLMAQRSRLREAEIGRLARERMRLHGLSAQLEAMSPLKVMGRGYSVVFRTADGRLVRSAEDVREGDGVLVRLAGSGCTTLEACDVVEATVVSARSGRAK